MRRFLSIVVALGLVLGLSLVTAVPVMAQPHDVWVDNDWSSQTDVDAYDSSLIWQYDAFATIQEGIDAVDPPGAVHVLDGFDLPGLAHRIGHAIFGNGHGLYEVFHEGVGAARDVDLRGPARSGRLLHEGGRLYGLADDGVVHSIPGTDVARDHIARVDAHPEGQYGLTIPVPALVEPSCLIHDLEGGTDKHLDEYAMAGTKANQAMVEQIRQRLRLTSLKYQRLEDLVEAIGLPKAKLCTHCWDGSSYF